MKKAYLIANNDKRFAKWVNETSNKLKMQNTFVYNANEIRYGNYFARASFVAYWHIHFDILWLDLHQQLLKQHSYT